MKKLHGQFFLVALFCLLLPLPSSGNTFLETFRDVTPILPKEELRAIWVVRHALASRDEIDRAVDFAIAARFHLLFVQVRGRGDAYYRSTLEPVASELTRPIDAFDPLQYLLRRAHEADIAVHAWVNMCYVWSDDEEDPPPGHILNTHPEWLTGNGEGPRMDRLPVEEWRRRGYEGYFVSPAHPDMRRHTVGVIAEIVSNYPVDGVHMDYIRYPGREFGLSEFERTEFALLYGIDPLPFEGEGGAAPPGILGSGGAHLIDDLRIEWRAAQVDTLVHMVRGVVGDLPLSAAVVPEIASARREKGQDWLGWIMRGDLDFVVPMAYKYEPGELVKQMGKIKRTIGAGRFLVGLPVFDERTRYLGYSVSLLRQEGIIGYSLFSYNALAEERFSLSLIERVFLQAFE